MATSSSIHIRPARGQKGTLDHKARDPQQQSVRPELCAMAWAAAPGGARPARRAGACGKDGRLEERQDVGE